MYNVSISNLQIWFKYDDTLNILAKFSVLAVQL